MKLALTVSSKKLIVIVTNNFFDIMNHLQTLSEHTVGVNVLETCNHEKCIQEEIDNFYKHFNQMHPELEMELVNKSDLTLTNPGDKVANDLLKQFSMN